MKFPNNFSTLSIVALLGLLIYTTRPKYIPLPTEIINAKQNRKQYKIDRQEWIENMHRAGPGIDWEKMNQQIRFRKIKQKTLSRKELEKDGNLSRESIQSTITNTVRDIPGMWIERGSNNLAGRIRTADIDFDNNYIYCASSGGNIWKGNLDGSDWASLNDYFQITGIHYLKKLNYYGTDRLIMTNGKQVYRSENDGLIIDEANGLESFQNWGWIFRSIVKKDPPQTIYLGVIEWDYSIWTYLPSIYKSTNGGESFSRIIELTSGNGYTVGSSHFDIWTPTTESGNVYVINDGKCYLLSVTDELSYIGEFSPSESGNNILIGGIENGQVFLHSRVGNQLYSSFDGGIAWVLKGDLPSSTFTINSFECSPIHSDKIAVGSVDGYYSNDGGDTWNLINHWYDYYAAPESQLHADIPEFNYIYDQDSGQEFQLISTDGGIYVSYDHFETVENLSLSGLGVSQYYSTYTTKFSPYHVYAGSQDQGFQRHISNSEYEGILDFVQVISGDYGHIVSGDAGTSIWTDYPGFAMYYPDIINSDNMSTWDFQGSGYLWLPPMMIDPYSEQIAYVGGGGINSQHHMVKLIFGMNGISAEDMPYMFDSKISAMAFSPLTNHQWYVSTEDGKFYFSLSNGESFTETSSFTGPGSHYFYGSTILPSPVDDKRIYIGGSGYSNPAVYLSTDGGETFSSFDDGLPNTLVYELVSLPDESMIFAATAVGPYFYSNDEGQWEDMAGEGAPDQTYWTVDYIPEIYTVRFGTYGRGIWDYTFDYNPVMLPGDVNHDDLVNIADLIMLVQIVVNESDISEYQWNVGDLNHDDVIDVIDVLLLSDILEG